MTKTISGHCLCGAVSFKAEAAGHDVAVCHCGMCRRSAGGPMMFIDTEGTPVFEGADKIAIYQSSEWGERGFCSVCGSNLFWKAAGKDQYTFSAGALDDQSQLHLATEIYIEDKPAFYDFANDTLKQTGAEATAAFVASTDKD